jgi:hypothetical protein
MSKEEYEVLEKIRTIVAENGKMLDMLSDELRTCQSLVDANPRSEELRRISVRTLFSNIEAICYRLKLSALPFAEAKTVKLENEEIAMINEESYFLADNGAAKIKKVYPKFTSNLQFTFKVYARVLGSDFKLDVESDKWDKFREAIDIRNRITHPKNLSDMKISKDDFRKATNAYNWFLANIKLLGGSSVR